MFQRGQKALHFAAEKGFEQIVKQLLEHGTTVDLEDQSIQLHTPLHRAAKNGFEQIVKLLLEHGSNVHLQDHVLTFLFLYYVFFCCLFLYCVFFLNFFLLKDGSTALHFAAAKGFEQIAKLLLVHGSNIHHQDKVLIFFFSMMYFSLLFFWFFWCDGENEMVMVICFVLFLTSFC